MGYKRYDIGKVRLPPPLMEVGVEYKTDEYWLTKPVYRKIIQIDELPEGTTTQVSIDADNIEFAFVDIANSWVGYLSNPGTNYATDSSAVLSLYVSNGSVFIFPAISFENVTAIVAVKYTKTTD